MGLIERLRPQPGWKDGDPAVRRAAVRVLSEPGLLAELAGADPDEGVREEAVEALLGLALEGDDPAAGAVALGGLAEPRHLVQVARSAAREEVARAALDRLMPPPPAPIDLRAIAGIARHGRHVTVCLESLKRLIDPAEIGAVALKSPHDQVALAAIGSLEAQGTLADDLLQSIADHARNPAAARRAKAVLKERGREAAARVPRPKVDRRRQVALCEEVEKLSRSDACEPLAARLSSLRDAWTDLLPDVDDDLDARLAAAVRAARERLVRNQADRLDRERRDRQREEFVSLHLAPREALCAMVEGAQGEEITRRLEDAAWEWGRLPGLDDEEIRTLGRRFETSCQAARARFEAWKAEQDGLAARAREERESEERERQRREAGERARENAERLKQACERLETLLQSGVLTLKQAEQGLREVREALEDLPPLPSRREREEIVERLKALRAALGPQFKELRETDEWKRWANANVQEDLCAQVESLREAADPEEAAKVLHGLQERWDKASAASKDRARTLWDRFRAASEEIQSRLAVVRAQQAAERADNARKKESLIAQAEALVAAALGEPIPAPAEAAATEAGAPAEAAPPAAPAARRNVDWPGTADALKRLQAEWKAIGASSRGREKALWERFHATCDRFFTRRNEDLSKRKEEWANNLERKESLIARAEAVAESTDWETTAEEVKRLQAEWKTIGPVKRHRSEAIWQRFRVACDRFFERYKRRADIDLETAAAARALICAELEALTAPEPGSAAPPETMRAAIQAAWDRWKQGPVLPRDQAAALGARFDAALERLIAARADAVKGSDFDIEANRRRLEDLCARVERLAPSGTSPDEAHLSPAARLASMWVERLASNTIGGKMAEEAKWRAAAEEVRRLQGAWQRVGYVPESARGPLAERFDRACRRIREQHESFRPAETGDRGRGRPGPRGKGTRPGDRAKDGRRPEARGNRPRDDRSRDDRSRGTRNPATPDSRTGPRG